MRFRVVKSYDGGKSWQADREFGDFGSATDAAQCLRTAHPYLRFRVEAAAERGASQPRRNA
jgi:hypothetical protein